MLIFFVWDVWVFAQSFFWDSLIQKLLWFCSQICHSCQTSHLSHFLNFSDETFHWYRVVFSLLLCLLSSWLLAWLYSLLFQADRTVHSCVCSSELVIVWVFLLFCWTDLICLSSDSVVDVALQVVWCMSAFELKFELSCLLILSCWKLFCWEY